MTFTLGEVAILCAVAFSFGKLWWEISHLKRKVCDVQKDVRGLRAQLGLPRVEDAA